MWAIEQPRARHRVAVVGLLMFAALLCRPAGAQAPAITDADIERARQQHRMPSDAELARVPVPAAPRLDALPQPATRPALDLEALSRGFGGGGEGPGPELGTGPTLLVFISFAIPETTITRLLDQAVRARATVVLRGLADGSIRSTVLRLQRLIGQRQVAVQIDPRAFDRYAITATPSFVLSRAGKSSTACATGSCERDDHHVRVAGDVSLDYALRFMERSSAAFAPQARMVLRRMKGAAP